MKKKIFVISAFAVLLVSSLVVSCKSDDNELAKTEPTKIEETSIFTTKYTETKVWDAFRTPSYPIAGQSWELYNLKGALDPDGGSLNWGTGRYMQFVAVVDNTNSEYSITDDLYNVGTKYTLMLKLYESNGLFVKAISNYGQIVGIGDKGFMYVAEGYYGMFFPIVTVKANDVVTYQPTTITVSKLSQLYK